MRMLVVAAALLLAGCESMSFYAQAIGGHLSVMRAARPVETWLADPGTPPTLRERLQTAQRIREFASRELGLPQNGSYHSYADVRRAGVLGGAAEGVLSRYGLRELPRLLQGRRRAPTRREAAPRGQRRAHRRCAGLLHAGLVR